jgi:hypothetical protein
MPDKLDNQLDALLSSRPLKADDAFADRVLAEAEARGLTGGAGSRRNVLLRFALPLAAAVVLSFAAVQLLKSPAGIEMGPALSEAEIGEILLLEDGLSGLSSAPLEGLDPSALPPTLDAITLEIEES